MKENINIIKIRESNLVRLNLDKLEFGKNISDHMFYLEYINGVWLNAQIVPFDQISLSPAALGLHYGQTVFEGMKAFKMNDGNISIFRIRKHYERLCKSLERMCMPIVPFHYFEEGLRQLVTIDREWIPETEGASLYIRPFMFASEERFGVHVSNEFKFIIFTGPVKNYYNKPLRIKVEENFIRASKGGTGYAKCGGNYGGSFYPAKLANEQGYDQVLWTDGSKDMYIEESGTMNIMFVINGVLVTPPLSDSILDGVTRDSFISIANDLGYTINERKISCMELIVAFKNNSIEEAFGSGTAAIASPIKIIHIQGNDYILPDPKENSFMCKAKNRLTEIRTGETEDIHDWNTIIKCNNGGKSL